MPTQEKSKKPGPLRRLFGAQPEETVTDDAVRTATAEILAAEEQVPPIEALRAAAAPAEGVTVPEPSLPTTSKTAAKPASSKKVVSKKVAAKKTTAAKKAPAKKKTTAKKAPAKKKAPAAKKTAAKKSTAKKSR